MLSYNPSNMLQFFGTPGTCANIIKFAVISILRNFCSLLQLQMMNANPRFGTSRYLLIMYTTLFTYVARYYMTNSYRPGIKNFDWFKAGL